MEIRVEWWLTHRTCGKVLLVFDNSGWKLKGEKELCFKEL